MTDIPLSSPGDLFEFDVLQIKLERLNEVERAFVHLDFESDHAPEH